MLKQLAVLGLAVGLCGAASAQIHPGQAPMQFGPPIQWRTFAQGANSGIQEAGVAVIRNETDLVAYWRLLTSEPGFHPAFPRNFDFRRQELIAIHLGPQQQSGVSVFVESVTRPNPHYWEVSVVRQLPAGRQTSGFGRLSSPYVLIAVDKTVGSPTFVLRDQSFGGRFIPAPSRCGCTPCHCGRLPVYMVGAGGTLTRLDDGK